MKLNSLLEYLLVEKIRSKTFNIREFKKLNDLENIHEYAQDRLQMIGEGSSRTAYILSSKYVLKLANLVDGRASGGYEDDYGNWIEDEGFGCEKGLAQNEAEAKTYMEASPEVQKVLPRIYDYHKHDYWLLTELVKPLNSIDEWTEISEVSWSDFFTFTQKVNDRNVLREYYEDSPFLMALYDLVKEHSISPEDLGFVEQWGYTADRRLVLLDTGATSEVLERYYSL